MGTHVAVDQPSRAFDLAAMQPDVDLCPVGVVERLADDLNRLLEGQRSPSLSTTKPFPQVQLLPSHTFRR